MKVLGVLDLFRSRPNLMRHLLISKPPVALTSDHIINLFKPILSPIGSNLREPEDAVVLKWINYIFQMIFATLRLISKHRSIFTGLTKSEF